MAGWQRFIFGHVQHCPADLARVPDVMRGTALTLMLAGILSVIFMGFAGLGS